MSSAVSKQCKKLRERLPEYAEGTLTGGPRARLERHLASCAHCADELAALQTVIRAVRATEPETVPDTLVPRVRRAVAAAVPAPAGAVSFWARLAVPVALATGLVAISFAFHASRLRESARLASPALMEAAPSKAAPGAAGRAGGGAPCRQEAKSDVAPELAEGMTGGAAPLAPARAESEEPGPPPARPRAQADRFAGVSEGFRSQAPAPRDEADTYEADTHMKAGEAGGAPRGPCGRPARKATAADRTRAERADAVGGAAAPSPPALPASSRVSLRREGDGPGLTLQVQTEAHLESVSVHAEIGGARRLLWQGRGGQIAPIHLSAEQLGEGPAAIPLEIESAGRVHRYVLFIPTMSRLGETAPQAPRASYRGESLGSALADLSALTGLVILAEPPLDAKVRGELADMTPEDALRLLAAFGERKVEFENGVVATLTRPE